MSTIKSLFFLIGVNSFVLMVSCTKTASEQIVQENLLIGKWQTISQKTNGTTFPIQDCEKDDFTIFNKDFNGIGDVGTIKCTATQVNTPFN